MLACAYQNAKKLCTCCPAGQAADAPDGKESEPSAPDDAQSGLAAAEDRDNGEANEETLFEERAILYQYEAGTDRPGWRQCGMGDMRVKQLPSGKSRMVMRQLKTGRLLMNALLIPELSLQRQPGAQQITFTCVNTAQSQRSALSNNGTIAQPAAGAGAGQQPSASPQASAQAGCSALANAQAGACSPDTPTASKRADVQASTPAAANDPVQAGMLDDADGGAPGQDTVTGSPDHAQARDGSGVAAAGHANSPHAVPPHNRAGTPDAGQAEDGRTDASAMQTYAVKFGALHKADAFQSIVQQQKSILHVELINDPVARDQAGADA